MVSSHDKLNLGAARGIIKHIEVNFSSKSPSRFSAKLEISRYSKSPSTRHGLVRVVAGNLLR